MKKLILNIIMTCILLLLFDTAVTGLFLHELLGLGLFLLFCLHKILNRKWICGIFTRQIKKSKDKFMLILNCILLFLVLTMTLSGILISQNLLDIWVRNRVFWTELHHFFAYLFLLFTGIHIGLHWRNILSAFRRIFHISSASGIRKTICRCAAFLLAAFGVYALTKPGVYSNFTEPFLPEEEAVRKASSGKKNHYGISPDAIPAPDGEVTLEEYLSRLFCDGCGRHCPLLAPSCGYGREMAEYAELRYSGQEILPEETTSSDPASDVQQADAVDPLFLMSLSATGTHYILLLMDKHNLKKE